MHKHHQELLAKLAQSYQQKAAFDSDFIVQFVFQPEHEIWHIQFAPEQAPIINKGASEAARFIFLLAPEILEKLSQGEISPLTAAGRAHISESAPLDFKLGEGLSLTTEIYLELIEFAQRFFNAASPECIRFGIEHARVVHGGNAVAMFYGKGFRSAWYQLSPGEKLNEPGDTNPFPQAFVFLSGQGKAQIGSKKITVQQNQAYFIPPHQEHIVWNDQEEALTLIFLAWGEGA